MRGSCMTSCVKFSEHNGAPLTMRKRSKYKPKGVRLDPISYVLSGIKPVLSHSASTPLRIRMHSAMTALTKGEATRSDIDALISTFNITEALLRVNPKLGSDWTAEVKAGQDALFNVAVRGATSQKFVLTGPEMAAMNLVVDVHEAQLEQATVLEIERATDMVHHRIRTNQTRKIVAK
jgi:hypothetical protein